MTARRLTLNGRSRHIGGQSSDESYQKTIEAINNLDMQNLGSIHQLARLYGQAVSTPKVEDAEGTKQFSGRYGRGVKLLSSVERSAEGGL